MAPPTILVVDDDNSILQLVSELLRGMGYEVVTASDGYGALQAFQRHKPALLILDFMMPGGLGSDVQATIHRVQGRDNVPIIFMSAAPQMQLEMALPQGPYIRLLPKPLDIPLLKQHLQEFLGPPPCAA